MQMLSKAVNFQTKVQKVTQLRKIQASQTFFWDKGEWTNVIFTLFILASIQRDWESRSQQVIKWEYSE